MALEYIAPILVHTAYGKVLATTPRGCCKAYPRIGVIGDDEADARRKFNTAMASWLAPLGQRFETGMDGDGI